MRNDVVGRCGAGSDQSVELVGEIALVEEIFECYFGLESNSVLESIVVLAFNGQVGFCDGMTLGHFQDDGGHDALPDLTVMSGIFACTVGGC